MARTDLTKTEKAGSYADSPSQVVMAAADTVNNNAFVASGNDLLIIHNTGETAHSVTISSVDDPYGRQGDVDSVSIPAGEIHHYGPMALTGWRQSDGKIYLEADDAEIEFGVITL